LAGKGATAVIVVLTGCWVPGNHKHIFIQVFSAMEQMKIW